MEPMTCSDVGMVGSMPNCMTEGYCLWLTLQGQSCN
jgi:hypothetical protein